MQSTGFFIAVIGLVLKTYVSMEPELPEDHDPPTPLWVKISRGLIATVTIGGLLYLSGVYQYFRFQRTPARIDQPIIASQLQADTLRVPLTVYVIVGGEQGSERTEPEARLLVERAANIWLQADVQLEIKQLAAVVATDEELQLLAHNTPAFVAQLAEQDPEAIQVLLVKAIGGGINGLAFTQLRSVLVSDYTSVHDFRALAHEIGHILDLEHAPTDQGKLMYRGANGTRLTVEEIKRARQAALRF